MTLQHSKTWPVNTVAVVQLRVDQNGRAYSTFMGPEPHRTNLRSPQPLPCDRLTSSSKKLIAMDRKATGSDGDVNRPLPQIFSAVYKPVRTNSVASILKQDFGGLTNSNNNDRK